MDETGAPPPIELETEFHIRRGLHAVENILNCSNAEFGSRSFILGQVKTFGLAFNDWNLLSRFMSYRNSGAGGLLQFPTEFCDAAMYIATLGIESAIEIGVYSGSSSYFLAAMLQRANPSGVYHMVDIDDHVSVSFDRFAALMNLEKHIPATSAEFLGQQFDFVFIDGDHSYEGALRDYANLGKFCRTAVAFHDIHGHEYDELNGGVTRMWREFKEAHMMDMRILEFSHSPTPWMGIGIGVKTT